MRVDRRQPKPDLCYWQTKLSKFPQAAVMQKTQATHWFEFPNIQKDDRHYNL